jgi:tetraacyldisaccharide 4'-kinase
MKTALTAPIAGIYFLVQKGREKLYDLGLLSSSKAPIPIISVGNIVMGGSGKSPFVIRLAQMALSNGLRPAIVSRGYRGSYKAEYMVVSEGTGAPPLCGPEDSGDEPHMMALRLPFAVIIVSRKRIVGAQVAAEDFNADLVILDDGLQHMRIFRDLDIAMLTGKEDHMFPMGALREPLSSLKRAHALAGPARIQDLPHKLRRIAETKPYFQTITEAQGLLRGGANDDCVHASLLTNKDVCLVSGIANPHRFSNLARDLGWRVIDHRIFPDHYSWSQPELRSLVASIDAAFIVFTEKDWVKLPQSVRGSENIFALRIMTRVKDEQGLWALAQSALRT